MDDVRLLVLGSRFRNRPGALVEVEFLPAHLRHLFAPLTRQRKKLDNARIWPTDRSGGEDNFRKLSVAQRAVAGDLLGGKRNSLGGRPIEDGSAHAPVQEGLDRLQRLVGCRWRTTLHDGRDDVDYISLRDLVNAATSQGLSN